MKRFLSVIEESVWFYPTVICVFSFVVSLLVGWVDIAGIIKVESQSLWIFFTSVGLAKTILSLIAGSLLTMTVFTFSTTMVVLTTYSAQFSHRVVKNFLKDDMTMKTLGVFMGGFVYSIMALSYMRESIGDRLVISASMGIVYVLICLMYFLRYINHVSSYLQLNNLIDRLSHEVKGRLTDYRKFLALGQMTKEVIIEENYRMTTIKSRESGYIQYVDFLKINKIATDLKLLIGFKKITGVFIVSGFDLFEVYTETGTIDEDLELKLLNCVTIGIEQTELQDFMYSVSKISEIALRALSPGINDPNSACYCIKVMGLLLSEVADIDKGYLKVYCDDEEEYHLFLELVDFQRLLHNSFKPLVHYGNDDLSVIKAIYKALNIILVGASKENKDIIMTFSSYVWLKIDPDIKEGEDGLEIHMRRNMDEND